MNNYPTHDTALEEIILSHICCEPSLAEHKKLKPSLFTHAPHRKLFETLKKLRQQGEKLNADAVRMEAQDLEELARHLSLRRLGDVSSESVIKRLVEMEKRRHMQSIAEALNEAAITSDDPVGVLSEQISLLMAAEDDHEETCSSVGDMTELIDLLEWRANNAGCIRGLSTGYTKLDKLTDGLHSGMIALGGKTSDGKSSYAMNICINVAKQLSLKGDDRTIYYGSYEMDSIDMKLRMASCLSGYPLGEGGLNHEQMRNLGGAIRELQKLNIIVDDKSHPSLNYVVNRLRKMHREKKLALACLDYSQLIKNPKSKGNDVQDMNVVSKTIQGLSRELGIPIIAVVMLRRPDKQFDKKAGKMFIPPPHTSDIKGSGSYEEDSYSVWLIYRDDENNTKLCIGKNRHGKRDVTIDLNFSAALYRFDEK